MPFDVGKEPPQDDDPPSATRKRHHLPPAPRPPYLPGMPALPRHPKHILPRRLLTWPILLPSILTLLLLYTFTHQPPPSATRAYPPPRTPLPAASRPPDPRLALVVASLKGDDTSWLGVHVPQHKAHVYVADDPSAELGLRRNKGRESMVYLTHIIEHYDDDRPDTPDTEDASDREGNGSGGVTQPQPQPLALLFIHARRYQWHNDDPLYDGVPPLQNFRIDNLLRKGYVNLRCVWTLGCPAEIRPLLSPTASSGGNTSSLSPPSDRSNSAYDSDPRSAETRATNSAYAAAFTELFPGTPIPSEVGVGCCAQFGVSWARIRHARSKSDYERYRAWLLATELPDAVSGRVLEYSWHVIFGMEAVHCPEVEGCYCEVFGVCGLECAEGRCEGRYVLPPFATMPEGWPEVGRGVDGWP